MILAIFLAIDLWYYRLEHPEVISHHKTQATVIRIRGWINVYLIGAIIAAILLSGTWKPDIVISIRGTSLELQNLMRDAIILAVAFASLKLTPSEHREANGFSWEPIREVAKLFAGIFVCIIPMLAMLNAGPRGAFAWMLALTSYANPHGPALRVFLAQRNAFGLSRQRPDHYRDVFRIRRR